MTNAQMAARAVQALGPLDKVDLLAAATSCPDQPHARPWRHGARRTGLAALGSGILPGYFVWRPLLHGGCQSGW